jgi:oxygen-independent coproporphyrinogen-3 oxidase
VIGLYLHIPFCSAICNYCNFNRGLFDGVLKARYVEALAREIREAPEEGTAVDTIYFGGGTPSLLEPDEVARVLEACRDTFDVAPDTEVTLEANPETVDEARLAGFRASGVTRVSIGVQSFRDEELRRLGRLHDAERARRVVADARAAGFENLSLDLMMWLPGQSVADWLASVDALVDVSPDHASMYLLEIYPNAPLRDEMARGGWSVAPDEEASTMYREAMERLESAGYRQYEISNVAREGRQSRHNLKYWRDGAWLGLGCGAHSTMGAVRWRNVAGTGDYTARVTRGEAIRVDVEVRSEARRAEEALFMGLRLTEGVDLAVIRHTYGIDVWNNYGRDLAPFADAGLLIHDPGVRLALTREGMLVASEIMMVFISPAVR